MKKEKLKIASDIDDTIVDFYGDFADFSKEYYNKEILPDNSFIDFWNLFGSREKTIEVIKKYDSLNRTYSLSFFKDFKAVFSSLKKNYDFSSLITARGFDKKNKTLEFFKKNIDGFDLNIYYTRDCVDKRKSSICKKLDIWKMIEDSPLSAIDCANNEIEVFLLDRFWNKGVKHKNIIRVKNWYEILEKLK